jgi:hypothetical protein
MKNQTVELSSLRALGKIQLLILAGAGSGQE